MFASARVTQHDTQHRVAIRDWPSKPGPDPAATLRREAFEAEMRVALRATPWRTQRGSTPKEGDERSRRGDERRTKRAARTAL